MKSLICIGLLLFALACDSSQNFNHIESIEFDKNLDEFIDLPLSFITDGIRYIPLETSKKCVVGSINKVLLEDDTIIVSGYNFCKSFNIEGRFIGDVGKTGKGPGEYTYVSELTMDHQTNTVYISCGMKIEAYSLSGKFKGTIYLPKEADSNGYYLGSDVFCSIIPVFRGNEGKSIVFFNGKNSVLNVVPNFHKFNREAIFFSSEDQGIIQQGFDNESYYKSGICDTIFRIGKDLRLSPSFYLNMGNYRMPLEVISGSQENYLANLNNYILLKDFINIRNGICFTFHFNKYLKENESKSQHVVVFGKHADVRSTKVAGYYDKQKSELVFLKSSYGFIGFCSDLDGGLPFWPQSIGSKNELLAWYSAEDMKESLSEEQMRHAAAKDSKAKEQLQNLVRTLDPTDNPVIVITNLKKIRP